LDIAPTALSLAASTDSSPESRAAPSHERLTDDLWCRLEFGARWPLWIGLGAVLMFTFGFVTPLADPDLPMHLATGAWIVQHRAVPWVEPFAWTRWGSPYYAYSWLAELVYQVVYVRLGAAGLHTLHGLTELATGGAMLWLASLYRWKSWTALILIFLTIVTSTIVAGFLRPQVHLIPLVLLSWACGLRVLDSSHPLRWAILLCGVAAVSANTHLLFALTGLPFAIAMSRTPFPRRRATLVAAALLTGWLISPYGLEWPKVFALYFGHNPLFDYPSTITEFTPGFRFAAKYPLWLFIAGVLALTPWVLADTRITLRERFVFGGIWFIGLAGFAMALRAIVVWWFATLPMLALVLERFPRPRATGHRRLLLLTLAALPIALIVRFGLLDIRLGSGVVPASRASVDPLARWLDEHVRLTTSTRPRVLTNFDYGSYLTWRLPAYSMSIDGRTVFPDSVALPDAYRFADEGPFPLGPWRTADLAILPLQLPVAAVLDTATGWVRLDSVPAGPGVPLASALWARKDWLRAAVPKLIR